MIEALTAELMDEMDHMDWPMAAPPDGAGAARTDRDMPTKRYNRDGDARSGQQRRMEP